MQTLCRFNLGVFARAFGVCVLLTAGLSACGDSGKNEVKAIKQDVQLAYGKRDFPKLLSQAQKGLDLSRTVNGDKAPDTLYFVQAVTEANLGMRRITAAIPALKRELEMRAAAGQDEKRLQPRRTLLIQLAEENGDPMTAAAQAVLVSQGIAMGPGKDPQRVYRTQCQYPPEMYRRSIEGDVEIAYSLDAGGKVTDARVSKATPANVFDQAAIECLKKWRFTPMLDNAGQPRSASGFKFTVAFRLKQ